MHIGGFFGLESAVEGQGTLHGSAQALHTGRACLMVMLSILLPKRVYVPYYTCDATLEPFRQQQVEIVFYPVDKELLPIGLSILQQGEYLLYTNYFGICEKQVGELTRRFGSRLLVDDTHAFFRGRRDGLWSFTSARKYFGVPDGAYLYAPEPLPDPPPEFENFSLRHLKLRKDNRQAEAFAAYQQYERSLGTQVFGISKYSRERLAQINFSEIAEIRRRNYIYLHKELSSRNRMGLALGDSVPFCYPYLPQIPIPHQQLYAQQIYPPKLWADVVNRTAPTWERTLVENLLPLPVDHRYGDDAMQYILKRLGTA